MIIDEQNLSSEEIIKLASLLKVKKRKSELEVKLEKLKLRAMIEEHDLGKEIDEISHELKNIEEKADNEEEKPHGLLILIQEKERVVNSLQKLHEKRDKIQDHVYNSLKEEYMNEDNSIQIKLEKIRVHFRSLINELQDQKKSLDRKLEEINLRQKIEELPDEVYNQKLSELNTEADRSTDLFEATTYLLSLVEKS